MGAAAVRCTRWCVAPLCYDNRHCTRVTPVCPGAGAGRGAAAPLPRDAGRPPELRGHLADAVSGNRGHGSQRPQGQRRGRGKACTQGDARGWGSTAMRRGELQTLCATVVVLSRIA